MGGSSKLDKLKAMQKEGKKGIVVDKTFGLKNKNKSKKVQQFCKQVQETQNKNKGIDAESKKKKKMTKLAKLQQEMELKALFSEGLSITVKKKDRGGLNVSLSVKLTHLDDESIRRADEVGCGCKTERGDRAAMLVTPEEGRFSQMMLGVTRSIGDWLAPDLVLPDPEFLELATVVSGAFRRVILASDGRWDVCSHQTAAKVARKHETPQEAADALLAIAKRAYIKERGLERVGDDTSVVVVDLNPGLVPFEPPAAGATCCALL